MKCWRSLMLLAVWLVIQSGTALSEPVRIAAAEYPPFQGRDLLGHGVIGQRITQAFALQGLDVEFGYFPWKRGYQYVQEGKWDATPYWGWSAERAETFLFSEQPILTVNVVFFHLASTDFNWQEVGDLQGMNIGGIDGYTYSVPFMAAINRGALNMNWSTNGELNFRKLLKQRITLFPQGKIAGQRQIAQMLERGEITQAEADSITWHPRPLIARELYLLFSKEQADLLDAFNQGYRKLNAEDASSPFWQWLKI